MSYETVPLPPGHGTQHTITMMLASYCKKQKIVLGIPKHCFSLNENSHLVQKIWAHLTAKLFPAKQIFLFPQLPLELT